MNCLLVENKDAGIVEELISQNIISSKDLYKFMMKDGFIERLKNELLKCKLSKEVKELI